MTWRVTTWADVLPGDVVLGADRMEWEVTSVHGPSVTMVRERRQPVRGRPLSSGPVRQRPGEFSAALAVLRDVFPGTERIG